ELWKGFSLSGSGADNQKSPKDLLKHFAELLRYAQ
ncbi:MAG: hypothetical protein JWR69_1810, partial [Pedosphaera sp.]|nr:hypothetical protein [Pedosphaera sp.]